VERATNTRDAQKICEAKLRLKFNVTTNGTNNAQGDTTRCPFCGKEIRLVFAGEFARDGAVILEPNELNSMIWLNVVQVAHFKPRCVRFGETSRRDARGALVRKALFAAVLTTGVPVHRPLILRQED
jgi:hypothetical protein